MVLIRGSCCTLLTASSKVRQSSGTYSANTFLWSALRAKRKKLIVIPDQKNNSTCSSQLCTGFNSPEPMGSQKPRRTTGHGEIFKCKIRKYFGRQDMVRQLACRKTWGKSKVKRDVRCWSRFSNQCSDVELTTSNRSRVSGATHVLM